MKDGNSTQRYLCRECGYRFSNTKLLNNLSGESSKRQVGTLPMPGQVKNLIEVGPLKDGLARATRKDIAGIKGKLVEYTWWMKKQAYAEVTIRCNISCIRTLFKRGANLYDPESVKDVMARQKWSSSRKQNVINAYTLSLKMEGLQWEKPKCRVTQKLPFIPTEQELDILIVGSGKKTSVFLQLLKETAMRAGEAKSLEWTDINQQRKLVTLNNPEKGSNARIWRVSGKLINMLNRLPRKSEKIFGDSLVSSLRSAYVKSRKRLAKRLHNPRLHQISFHTFRHWKATMLYHKTRDPYYVKNFLGHKSLRSTERYITLEQTIFEPSSDRFTVKVAEKPEEIKELLEVGFEYVCKKDELTFLRKPK